MKHYILLFLLLIFVVTTGSAQGILEVKDVSTPVDVYTSQNDEAAVMVRCHQSIPLTFSSSMDKEVEPYKVDKEGSENIYYIEFPTGARYRGRVFTIIASGYYKVNYELELKPKQLVTLQVTDPNALVDAGCYRGHRNRGMQEIKNANYKEALNQFVIARECSDVNKDENEKNIALVDSIIHYREMADNAYNNLDYFKAAENYEQVLKLNPYDTYALHRNEMALQNFSTECESLFSQAEFYFTEKNMKKATELYQQVVDQDCSKKFLAHDRMLSIESNNIKKKTRSRVFTYEWMKDTPIGFSCGSYNIYKVGSFFSMSMNSKVLDAVRKDCIYGDKEFAEINMSFGWTIKIVNPIWIHIGPGFTGKLYYGRYQDKMYPVKGYGEIDLLDTKKMGSDLTIPRDEAPINYEDEWKHANLAFAVSPVIGVTLKYSFFTLRASYQYRWTVKKYLQDFMCRNRVILGIGIAF